MKAPLALPTPEAPEPRRESQAATWTALTDAFLAEYRGASQRTYRDAWRQFTTFCQLDPNSPASAIPDEDAVKAFRDALLDTGHSPHTINLYLAVVRAFYKFLHGQVRKALRTGQITAQRAGELQLLIEGVLAVNKVRASSAPARLPTTIDQARELLTSIQIDSPVDLRDRAMIALMLGCGLRRIEVARAQRRDLKHHGGKLLLRIQQKGHHQPDAYVVVWPGVERLLRPWFSRTAYKRPDDPLFPSLSKRDAGSPLTPKSVSRIVRQRLDAVGLTDHTAHSLRHSFATIALSADDVDLRDVQSALGHSQVTTTERYVHQAGRLEGKPEKAVNDLLFSNLD